MIYMWVLPKILLNKMIAIYDKDISPDRFLFLDGIKLTQDQVNNKISFSVKVSQMEISKYDCIPNNAGSSLVNQKVVELLLKLAPDLVQFYDADIQCIDGILTGYKLLNITRTIKGIDHEKSIYTKMKLSDAIAGFNYLTYKPDCMGLYNLARDEEYLSNLLVTEEIKNAFQESRIKGVNFVKPEEFYRPLRP